MHGERVQAYERPRSEVGELRLPFPRPGPKFASAVIWWAFGLYALFVAQAPFVPSLEAENDYNELMQRAIFSDEGRAAEREYIRAKRQLDEVDVIGWRWRSPYDVLVPERRAKAERQRRLFQEAMAERDALLSEAKSTVGIWSRYGVEEVRATFWTSYQWGKDFAKRMSFWDVLLGVGGRRDEEAWVTMMRYVGQIMMNFTVGLVSALVSFGFSLVQLLWVYKTSWLSGALFFFVAMSGASAMVAAFCGGMYATAAGGVYVIARQAHLARLEGRAQHQRVRQRRTHYE
jgi:hypothetical protein|tara:strand:+ start:393 stop:1256 length:864 start_codon:yes stop_codon:yes gene_type:complete